MAKSNKATEAQAKFIEALAAQATDEAREAAFAKAFRINQNARNEGDFSRQSIRRLSKRAASSLIDTLKGA